VTDPILVELNCPVTGQRCKDSHRACPEAGYDCWDDGSNAIPADGLRPADVVIVVPDEVADA
jgi:hypothetical protein